MRRLIEEVIDEERKAGLLSLPLLILTTLYGAASALRNKGYDSGLFGSEKVNCPVISVGALQVGGAGKTPFVHFLTKRYSRKKITLLLRGYGADTGEYHEVSDGVTLAGPPPASADEAFLLARALCGVPVVTAPDRVAGARGIIERFAPDLIILDDGFAHRRLARDLNIVLLDAKSPFGNGYLLPRGPLRESPSALCRADLIVLIGKESANTREIIHHAAGKELAFITVVGSLTGFTDIRGRVIDTPQGPVWLLAGIARPRRFFDAIEKEGITVAGKQSFGDHHAYSEDEIRSLLHQANGAPLVTTEKDAVRLLQFEGKLDLSSLVVARYEMAVTSGADILDKMVENL